MFVRLHEKIGNNYKKNGDLLSMQKLFDFCEPLDLTHWAYNSQLNLFYSITQRDRKLYIANLRTNEQKIRPDNNDFPIAALALHPDQRILVLLSQSKDKLWYVDAQTLLSVRTTIHPDFIPTIDMPSQNFGQVMAFDGKKMFLALAERCLVIKMPLFIFKMYEKYHEIVIRWDFLDDLRKLIAARFVTSVIFAKDHWKSL